LCLVNDKGERVWEGEPIDDTVKYVSMTIAYEDERAEKINHSDLIKLENAGLYWHLVDIIWIFLFPLFYLIS
jgi:heme/copper-type cytochrome/quinol oxidase subunit 3